jgi:type I restriction enzyme, S subunit
MSASKWKPYPEYKQSGIESIGEIPSHWQVIRAKRLERNSADLVQTGPFGAQLHASDYIDDEIDGIPLILIRNVRDLKIDDDNIPRISPQKAKELSLYRLKKGDIVFSRVGSVGRIAKVSEKEEGWLISGQMLRLRFTTPKIDTDFAVYSICSEAILTFFDLQSVGTTRDSINSTILSEMPMIVPPIEEQKKIVAFINNKLQLLDLMRSTFDIELELLKEYKIALISSAVSGKIDVSKSL